MSSKAYAGRLSLSIYEKIADCAIEKFFQTQELHTHKNRDQWGGGQFLPNPGSQPLRKSLAIAPTNL